MLPTYNAAAFLQSSIQSILSQTYEHFEIIIINDGSTDNSEKIILSFSDKRIRYYKNKDNTGLIDTLNKGITLAKGNYLARMDADDISLPNRLKLQVELMEKRPSIGICGTWIEYFNETRSLNFWKCHTSHEALKGELLFGAAIPHPTVMIRKSILEKSEKVYDSNFPHAEDYELWTRLIFNTQFYCIPRILLRYRIHDDNISKKHRNTQKKITQQIRLTYYKKIFNRQLTKKERNAILENWNSPNSVEGLLKLTDAVLQKRTLLKKQGVLVYYQHFLSTLLKICNGKNKETITLRRIIPLLLFSFHGIRYKVQILKSMFRK